MSNGHLGIGLACLASRRARQGVIGVASCCQTVSEVPGLISPLEWKREPRRVRNLPARNISRWYLLSGLSQPCRTGCLWLTGLSCPRSAHIFGSEHSIVAGFPRAKVASHRLQHPTPIHRIHPTRPHFHHQIITPLHLPYRCAAATLHCRIAYSGPPATHPANSTALGLVRLLSQCHLALPQPTSQLA